MKAIELLREMRDREWIDVDMAAEWNTIRLALETLAAVEQAEEPTNLGGVKVLAQLILADSGRSDTEAK